jgi:hypothetical protein
VKYNEPPLQPATADMSEDGEMITVEVASSPVIAAV